MLKTEITLSPSGNHLGRCGRIVSAKNIPGTGDILCSVTGTVSCVDYEYPDVYSAEESFSESGYLASRMDLVSDMIALPRKYAVPDWDGYGASPLSVDSFRFALSVIQGMRQEVPSPRVVVDPDGDVCFKWGKTRHNRLELTFSKNQTCYALMVKKGMRTLLSTDSRYKIVEQTEWVLDMVD